MQADDHIDAVIEQVVERFTGERPVNCRRLGGLTNENYKLDLQNGRQLLLKVVNKANGLFVDRDLETRLMDSFKQLGLVQEMIAVDGDYRLQEFVEGSELTIEDLRSNDSGCRQQLVDAVVNFHNKASNCHAAMLNEEPMLLRFLHKLPQIKEKASKALTCSPFKQICEEAMEHLSKELPWLLEILETLDGPKQLCHNDVNLSNCLRLNRAEDLQRFHTHIFLLDLEYAGPNFLYFDLANLLHELDCVSLPAAPFFALHEDTPQQLDLKLDLLRRFYPHYQHLSNQSFDDFADHCLKFQIFAYFYWLWLCINDAPGGWEGTPAYIQAKTARYESLKAALMVK